MSASPSAENAETPFRGPPLKPAAKRRLVRFVRLARGNLMVGGGWNASIRVAWMDSRRRP